MLSKYTCFVHDNIGGVSVIMEAGQIGPKQNRSQVKSDPVKSAPDQNIVL